MRHFDPELRLDFHIQNPKKINCNPHPKPNCTANPVGSQYQSQYYRVNPFGDFASETSAETLLVKTQVPRTIWQNDQTGHYSLASDMKSTIKFSI